MNELLHDLRARGKITLSQFHALKADSEERLMAVRRRLNQDGIAESGLAAQCSSSTHSTDRGAGMPTAREAAIPPTQPAAPRRSLLEIILDPRSIQCLLGLGGALIVVGLTGPSQASAL